MDMASGTMPMNPTATMADMMSSATASAAMASATSMKSMSMGDMGMGGGSSCKISMLWNWYTVDACFLSSGWHITSKSMFGGSCIGVILLVMALELLRRLSREYDRYLVRQKTSRMAQGQSSPTSRGDSSSDEGVTKDNNPTNTAHGNGTLRPSIFEQAIRALLHMLTFACAYFIMLLAMYYNGYIIICIFIGAYIGYFIFGWQPLTSSGSSDREVTFCCG